MTPRHQMFSLRHVLALLVYLLVLALAILGLFVIARPWAFIL
jgi:hypothetical protein